MDKTMKILDGKTTAQKITNQITEKINHQTRRPRLDILLVEGDFASDKYVRMKENKAIEVGVDIHVHRFKSDCSQEDLINLINDLNSNEGVDGIMIQLPLPSHIEESKVLELISPKKDVDGLTSVNLGLLVKNDSRAVPSATPRGVTELLREYSIGVDGMKAVVVGRSSIVGLPMAAMLQNMNATVTVCHSHTRDLKSICKDADILVVGIGKAEYITKEFVKEGCIVIDVGTNKNSLGELVGDVNFDSVKDVAGCITPVPGGIGPMTIASLLLNLLEVYERNVEGKNI